MNPNAVVNTRLLSLSFTYPAIRMLTITVAPTAIPANSPTCQRAQHQNLKDNIVHIITYFMIYFTMQRDSYEILLRKSYCISTELLLIIHFVMKINFRVIISDNSFRFIILACKIMMLSFHQWFQDSDGFSNITNSV